jgi:hypothetical protein
MLNSLSIPHGSYTDKWSYTADNLCCLLAFRDLRADIYASEVTIKYIESLYVCLIKFDVST